MRNTTLLRPLLALFFACTLNSSAQAMETASDNASFTIKNMAALDANGDQQMLFEDGDSIRFSAKIETISDKPMLLFGRTSATGVDGFKGKTFLVKFIRTSDNYTINTITKAKVPAGAEGIATVKLELFTLKGAKADTTISISINKAGTATEILQDNVTQEIATQNYYTSVGYIWKYTTPASYLTYADLPVPAKKFLIDVRDASEFVQGHIQDAFNLSRADLMDNSRPEILFNLVPDINTPIITYCNGYGQDKQFADQAATLGYQNVRYYTNGINEWKTANYLVMETERVKEIVDANDNSSYIVDVWTTDTADNAKGIIPGAKAVDISEFWDSTSSTLVDNGTALTTVCPDNTKPIIFYCGGWACGKSKAACSAAKKLGYTKQYRYQGGVNEWKDVYGYTTVPTP
jgi:rhodanese-related sulfurtransferase